MILQALGWPLPLSLLLFSINNVEGQKRRIVLSTKKSLVTARIDPIVSHDAISQHSHHVVGGNNFDRTYGPIKQRASTCSNLGVHADLSAYWQPQLFQRLTNGSYIAMWSNTRIYYEQPNTKSGVKVEPFPENFGMIAGDAARKTLNPNDQGQILQSYYCEIKNADGSIKSKKETHSMPTQPCDVIVTKSWFPTCWNGKAYDRANPKAHVAYPNFGGGFLGANCPTGFDRRFISIHMETYYWRNKNVPRPADGQPQFILANGDTTGYGLHADFVNGWDTKVLTDMINNCKTVPVEEPASQACAALKPSYDRAKGDNCMYLNKIPDEEVGYGHALNYLPGCNLPWSSGAKPTCSVKQFKGNPGWIKPAAGTVWP